MNNPTIFPTPSIHDHIALVSGQTAEALKDRRLAELAREHPHNRTFTEEVEVHYPLEDTQDIFIKMRSYLATDKHAQEEFVHFNQLYSKELSALAPEIPTSSQISRSSPLKSLSPFKFMSRKDQQFRIPADLTVGLDLEHGYTAKEIEDAVWAMIK